MAYLALYRKWRPQTFEEVVGQKHISLPLTRAIEQDRLTHAYLFSGPRGTGKTTMAKILSKAVNCEHPHGADPCNQCESCREINAGASMDVYEIDAASNRGIEEIRALKESVRTLPTSLKKKVYIIDEVHMLTKEAFDALLKTLEEPPSYVLFILATTQPEKIPLTILSRCQRYEFHRISVEDIRNHLLRVAKASDFTLTEEAADLIAVRADGGLRDALSLLDQCSSAADGKVLDAETTYNLLGLTGKDQIIELSHDIFENRSGEALSLFYDILQSGKEPQSVLESLIEHFRNLMIARVNPDAPELSAYGNKKSVLIDDARKLSCSYTDALFDELHRSLAEAKRSSFYRLSSEMCILRLCRLRESNDLAGRLTALEKEVARLKQTLAGGQYPAPAAAPVSPSLPEAFPPASPANPVSQEEHSAPGIPSAFLPPEEKKEEAAVPAPLPKQPVPAERRAPAAVPTPDEDTVSSPAKPSPSSVSSGAADLIDPAAYGDIWNKVLAYLMSIHRIDVYTCLKKSTLIYANQARAIVAAPQQFLVIAGNNKSYQAIAAEAFQHVINRPLVLHTVLKGGPEEAEAFALLKSSPAPKPAQSSSKGGYKKINAAQISPQELSNPALSEALKILPDCDIYEKD